jgi:hypothetical protein
MEKKPENKELPPPKYLCSFVFKPTWTGVKKQMEH